MTITQMLLASAAGLPSVSPNQLVLADVSLALGNDITAPIAIKEFRDAGGKRVFDKDKVCFVMDHFSPCKDIKSAEQCKLCRDFAAEQELSLFFDCGAAGIEHCLLPEKGLVTAGDIIIGADSHTCTYGALGAFSTGVGSTDLAFAMLTGKCWFKVPEGIRVEVVGELHGVASGKDVALTLIGMLGVDGALYASLEFSGSGLASLSVSDRLCISNMAVECGAKNAVFPVDELTLDFLKHSDASQPKIYLPDNSESYSKTITLNLDEIVPVVAFPSLPSNVKRIDEIDTIPIDQVYIGSCTNGRLDDLIVAAGLLKNKHINKRVRCIIVPATQSIYLQAVKLGLIEIFINAGCAVSTPTCGACLGGFMGVLADGERCAATTNRNFVGRMGAKNSEVYLVSPATAAQTALSGYLDAPKELNDAD